jgi:uncharacterized protein (TIGR02569 family)
MGRTWAVGDVVLKPVDDTVQHAWVSEVFESWPRDSGVRVPQPLRRSGGDLTAAGWAAHRWLDGETARAGADPTRFHETWRRFHAVTATLERPSFLDTRADPWSFGDRVAWEGMAPQGSPATLALLQRLLPRLKPVDLTDQVVHGDLGGNVLFAPGLPPAVIDWPPYFRPAAWALAVVAADAVCWEGAPLSLLDAWSDVPHWDQLLLRAAVYRIATRGRNETLEVTPAGSDGYVAQQGRVTHAMLERVAGTP